MLVERAERGEWAIACWHVLCAKLFRFSSVPMRSIISSSWPIIPVASNSLHVCHSPEMINKHKYTKMNRKLDWLLWHLFVFLSKITTTRKFVFVLALRYFQSTSAPPPPTTSYRSTEEPFLFVNRETSLSSGLGKKNNDVIRKDIKSYLNIPPFHSFSFRLSHGEWRQCFVSHARPVTTWNSWQPSNWQK